MDKIIQGVRKFQASIYQDQRELFEELGKKQQSPQALFITCSDSRINPNLITSTEPGDLFLLRNAGNIVPPYGSANGGEGATIEYAISVLKIKNIIICGHYHCGAMGALMQQEKLGGNLPAVRAWFGHAEATRQIITSKYEEFPLEVRVDLAVLQNVLVQIENLRTHPSVAVGLARGEVNIYGWVYRIETGEVLAYDSATGRYAPLSDASATPLPLPTQLCDRMPVATMA